ncbi:hypothetical protein GCM10010344_48450 [Streptomyces bluensis]|nr:hypothetical protein GCM10010344_48450 [Streptomyces bluensis]
MPHRLGRAEARVVGHLVDGQVAGLQQVTGPLDALLGEPLTGADAGLLPEAAGEGPYRHGLPRGHVPQLDRLVQTAQRPGAGGGRGRRLRVGHRPFDVLRLPAVTVRRNDRAPGHLVGHRRAVVAAHHVQAQVDAGRDARGGQHVSVVDEQHIGVDLDPGEQPLQALGVGPVRGGGAAVEEAGGGEDVHAGADGGEPGAGPDVREGGGQLVGEHALLEDRPEFVRRRDDDRVRGGQRLGPVLDLDREVGIGPHRAGRPDRAGHDLVQVPSRGVLRAAEDPVRDAQLEGQQSVEGEDDDPVRTEPLCAAHGPILANTVSPATRWASSQDGSSMA